MRRVLFLPLAAALLLCGCPARRPEAPAPAGASAAVEARAEDGSLIGRLRELDDYPLYELEYEAPYSLEDQSLQKAALIPSAGGAFACTCFEALDSASHRVMGRNFDWYRHRVLVLLARPRVGYASVSLVDLYYLGYGSGSDPMSSQAGLSGAPGIPFDGMNEKGLAVGIMAIGHAEGSADPSKPTVHSLGMIRVLLDRAGSVDEAIELLDSYNVTFPEPPVHYFIADRSGASVVAELIGGKLRLARGKDGWQVSTNLLFAELAPELRAKACWRYSLASARLSASGGRLGRGGAFGLLEAVSQNSTTWSSAYDQTAGALELALGRDWGRRWRWAVPASGPRLD
jgi:hypothetical protein